jgi:predicted lipid-binding transport protein (Tim44 family)
MLSDSNNSTPDTVARVPMAYRERRTRGGGMALPLLGGLAGGLLLGDILDGGFGGGGFDGGGFGGGYQFHATVVYPTN